MLECLGYELLTPETAKDLHAIKDGNKYVVAFASTLDQLPTQANHLTRLHRAIIAANAAGGFYVTTRGFSRDAEAYAKTAPIKLVDGPKLVASITRSMEGMPAPDSYKAMCRQCGDIVTLRLDRAEAIPCTNGHPVAPTIAARLSCRSGAAGRIDQPQLFPAPCFHAPRSERAQLEIYRPQEEAAEAERTKGTRRRLRRPRPIRRQRRVRPQAEARSSPFTIKQISSGFAVTRRNPASRFVEVSQAPETQNPP